MNDKDYDSTLTLDLPDPIDVETMLEVARNDICVLAHNVNLTDFGANKLSVIARLDNDR